jgi:hypothetical protein
MSKNAFGESVHVQDQQNVPSAHESGRIGEIMLWLGKLWNSGKLIDGIE